MEPLTGVLAVLTGFLGFLLALVTLGRKIINAIKSAARDVLIEAGLTKYGEPKAVWPNGSENLPDFLEHLYELVNDKDKEN